MFRHADVVCLCLVCILWQFSMLRSAYLQTTQPTSGGAVTADSSCRANCVEPSRPQQWEPDLHTGLLCYAHNTKLTMHVSVSLLVKLKMFQYYMYNYVYLKVFNKHRNFHYKL